MKRHLFSLILVALIAIFGFDAETPVEVKADPQSGTVYGAITAGDYLYSYSFDGTSLEVLTTKWVQFSLEQDFHNGAFLPGVELFDGTRGLLITWMSDPDPSLAQVKIYKPNGGYAGYLAMPTGVDFDSAQRFYEIDGNLHMELVGDLAGSFWIWDNGLDQPPTQKELSNVDTVQQYGIGGNYTLIGSIPNGRIILLENGVSVYESSSNNNFCSTTTVINENFAFGEVDGSLFKISLGANPQKTWVRALNDVTALAGTTNPLVQTYGTQGTGLVTYDAMGNEIFESATVSDIDVIAAAGSYGIIANGTMVEIIDLSNHETLATYETFQSVSFVQMAEEYVPQSPTIYVNYLPLLTSN